MKESNGNRRKEEGKREKRSSKEKINKDLFFSLNGCNQSGECGRREMQRVVSKNERERLKKSGRKERERDRERGGGLTCYSESLLESGCTLTQ